MEDIPSQDVIKQVIEKRLRHGENISGFEPGSLIQITDDAYQAIAEVTRCNIGLALELMTLFTPSAEQLENQRPYTITGSHIKESGLTYERLCAYRDDPLRRIAVIHIEKPPWLR